MGFLFTTSPIIIQAGGIDYGNNNTYNFGTVTTGATSQLITFTIQNTGTENILFPGTPVAVSGDDAADFTVTDPGISVLAPGATATFTAIFTPGGDGARDGVITILNNENEVIYTLNLTGTGTPTPVPDIYVEVGGTYYASGSGYNFGPVSLGFSSAAITFTIRNTGQAGLALTGAPIVATGGADASDFTVSGPAGATIPAGAIDTFTVTFTPTSLGRCAANIRVQSNDPDVPSYIINLTGTGIALPTISPVTIASDNANTSVARTGDTVTLSFTADVAIQTPTVTIAGNPAAVSGGPTSWTAAYTMTASDAEGTVPFVISNIMNLAGAAVADVTATTDGSIVNFDRTAPAGYAVTIDQAMINSANQAACSFTFSGAEIGTTYDFTITSSGGGTAVTGSGPVTAAGQQVTGINTSGLNDGILTLNVTLTDTAGNAGAAATATVSKDRAAPAGYTAVIDQPYINSGNVTALSITFASAEVGTTYSFTISSSGGGTAVTGSGAVGAPSQSLSSIDVSGLNDGTLTLNFTLTDAAGNTGAAATDTAIKDTTLPTVAIGPPSPAAINGSGSVNYTVTYTGANTVSLDVGNVFMTTTSGTAACSTVNVTNGATSTPTVTISGCAGDGTINISISAGTSSDTAGNLDVGAGPGADFTVDATAPSGYTVSVDQTAINSGNVSAFSFTFTGAEVGSTYNYTVSSSGGGTNATGSGTVTAADETISGINVSGPNDGTLTLSVTLTDTGGNTGPAATDTVEKDTVAPAGYSVSIDLASINSGNVAGFSFTFSGAETGTICNYTISSSGGGTNATGSVGISSANQNISGIDVSGPNDGTLTLSVVLIDALGNTGFAATDMVVKDTVAPTLAIGVPSIPAVNGSGSVNFGISYTGADTVNLTSPSVSLTTTGDASCAVSVADGTTPTPTVTLFSCSGNGTVRISIASGTAFDTAGNSNMADGPGDPVTVDTLNPSLSFSSVPPINAANAAAYVVAGFCTEEGMPVTVTVGGLVTDTPTCTSSMYTTSSMNVSGISDSGSVSVAVSHSDAAGNTENISTTVVKDTTLPTLTMSPVPGNITYANQGAYTVSGACSEEGRMVTVTVIDDESSSVSQGPTCSSGWYTTSLDVSGLSDGVGRLTITHTDAAGNTRQTGIDPLAKDTTYPIMNVRINGTNQPTSSIYDFGTVEIWTVKAVTVDIYNTGTGTLELPVSPVVFSGANMSEFTTADLESGVISVNPGDMATFILQFMPTDVVNPRQALMSITSNDPNIVGTYDIALQGNGSASNTADINVKVNGLSLDPGGGFDFGTVTTGSTKTARVDVYNNGSAILTLDPIWLTGVNPSEYLINGSIKGPITIQPGGMFSFMASFAPTRAMASSAQLIIASNDPDTGSFVVTLLGTGTAATTQDIGLKINNLEVANASSFDFGQVLTSTGIKTVTVEIANKGTADLTLSSMGAPVYLTGTNFPDWDYFTGAPGPGTVITAGTSVTFTMDFIPPVDGLRYAQLRVLSDDPDTGTYVVNLKGTGSPISVPDIGIELNGQEYSPASTFDFGAELVDMPLSVNADILNQGSAILNISGGTVVSISGPDSADFAVTGSGAWPAPESVPAGSSLVVSSGTGCTVEFTPSAAGVRRAQMTVVSDDPDTGTYVVNLQGIGVMPRVMVCGGGTSDSAIFDPMMVTFSAGNPTGSQNVGAGGHSFKMQNGSNQHVLIYGSNSYWAIFNPASATFVTQGSFGSNANQGANSFPIAGGNYINNNIILLANASLTRRFSPPFSIVAYDSLSSIGYGSFTFPIPAAGGQMMIIHGGFSNMLSVFDPNGNAGNGSFTTIGNTLTSGAQYGAHSIMIDAPDSPNNGSVLVILGGDSSIVNLFTAGSFSNFGGKTLSGPAGRGASSVPILTGLHRGKKLIIHGGSSGSAGTTLFNPLVDDATTFTAGPDLAGNASYGSFSFVIEHGPNAGLIVVVHGGSTSTTSVCDPKNEPLQFNLGPNLPNSGWQYTAGDGAHSFPLK
ncbi:MAG TPA: choice-of-anchor D domain-containing protein [Spirochaetota bacterium]|nr:choice-of-anchor D domain-containing protein [Spirochaetota bacterium]HPV40274.1 choice-of-anchor D domain-containing protein [Spirochaetota bacterium]